MDHDCRVVLFVRWCEALHNEGYVRDRLDFVYVPDIGSGFAYLLLKC